MSIKYKQKPQFYFYFFLPENRYRETSSLQELQNSPLQLIYERRREKLRKMKRNADETFVRA